MSDRHISPSVRSAAITLCVSPEAVMAYLEAMRSWDRTNNLTDTKSHEEYPIQADDERRHR